ncbi:hypothetical protein FMN50_03480 [Rhodobacterales bacterium]|nr:hypothetical protein FMN50_03480 [Rhodobacterales bacterium]
MVKSFIKSVPFLLLALPLLGNSPHASVVVASEPELRHMRQDLPRFSHRDIGRRVAQADPLLREPTTSRLLEELEQKRRMLEQDLLRLEEMRLRKLRALQAERMQDAEQGRQQFDRSQFNRQEYQPEQHRRQQFKHQQYQTQQFRLQ